MERILFPICYSEVVLGMNDYMASVDSRNDNFLTVNMGMPALFYYQKDLGGRKKI